MWGKNPSYLLKSPIAVCIVLDENIRCFAKKEDIISLKCGVRTTHRTEVETACSPTSLSSAPPCRRPITELHSGAIARPRPAREFSRLKCARELKYEARSMPRIGKQPEINSMCGTACQSCQNRAKLTAGRINGVWPLNLIKRETGVFVFVCGGWCGVGLVAMQEGWNCWVCLHGRSKVIHNKTCI